MNFRLYWLFSFAVLLTSCATRNEEISFCETNLSMEKIASDLGFRMEDKAMHQYHFSNKKYEFDLLASAGEVGLYDESSYKSSSITPIWIIRGQTTEEEVESRIRIYLYGK